MSPRAIVFPLLLLANPVAAESWTAVTAILEERCVICHSGDHAPLGLSLDSHAGVLAGSENGAVVDRAAPGQSPILQRLTGEAEPRMPLDGPPWELWWKMGDEGLRMAAYRGG